MVELQKVPNQLLEHGGGQVNALAKQLLGRKGLYVDRGVGLLQTHVQVHVDVLV